MEGRSCNIVGKKTTIY